MDNPQTPPTPERRRSKRPGAAQAIIVAAASSVVQDPSTDVDRLWRAIGRLEATQETQGGRIDHIDGTLDTLGRKFEDFKKDTGAKLDKLTTVVLPFVEAEKKSREHIAAELAISRRRQEANQERIAKMMASALPILGAILVLLIGRSVQSINELPPIWYWGLLVVTLLTSIGVYIWAISHSVPKGAPEVEEVKP